MKQRRHSGSRMIQCMFFCLSVVFMVPHVVPLAHAQVKPGAGRVQPSGRPATSGTGIKVVGGVASNCGPAAGGMFPSPPQSNLCAAGSVVTVPVAPLGATQYQWTCGGSGLNPVVNGMPIVIAPSVCTANKKFNGQCGSASGVATASAPTANLCALGTASTPTLNGTNYTWSCTGVLPATGATVASCSAPAASIVQAVSESVSGTAGAQESANVRANDTAPQGSVYSLAAGSTCSPVSVTALGVVYFAAPAAGQSCVVNYTVCNSGQCSTATLTVTVAAPPTPTYTIGVNVSGLPSGSHVLLQNNGGNNLTVAANGAATFSTAVSGAYAVTVLSQPAAANCVVTGGAGTASANVNNISVVCSRFSLVPKASGGFYDVTECVKDNATGLIWEGKTASGVRAGGSVYTNFDDINQGQHSDGTNPTVAEVNHSTNSIGYQNMVNGMNLCGSGAWRMPTRAEMLALSAAIGGAWGSSTRVTWLPNGSYFHHWTSSASSDGSAEAWLVHFNGVFEFDLLRSHNAAVRLVRASQ